MPINSPIVLLPTTSKQLALLFYLFFFFSVVCLFFFPSHSWYIKMLFLPCKGLKSDFKKKECISKMEEQHSRSNAWLFVGEVSVKSWGQAQEVSHKHEKKAGNTVQDSSCGKTSGKWNTYQCNSNEAVRAWRSGSEVEKWLP